MKLVKWLNGRGFFVGFLLILAGCSFSKDGNKKQEPAPIVPIVVVQPPETTVKINNLFDAISKADIKAFDELLVTMDITQVNGYNSEGQTALFYAVKMARYEFVQKLLAKQAFPLKPNQGSSRTPLEEAEKSNDSLFALLSLEITQEKKALSKMLNDQAWKNASEYQKAAYLPTSGEFEDKIVASVIAAQISYEELEKDVRFPMVNELINDGSLSNKNIIHLFGAAAIWSQQEFGNQILEKNPSAFSRYPDILTDSLESNKSPNWFKYIVSSFSKSGIDSTIPQMQVAVENYFESVKYDPSEIQNLIGFGLNLKIKDGYDVTTKLVDKLVTSEGAEKNLAKIRSILQSVEAQLGGGQLLKTSYENTMLGLYIKAKIFRESEMSQFRSDMELVRRISSSKKFCIECFGSVLKSEESINDKRVLVTAVLQLNPILPESALVELMVGLKSGEVDVLLLSMKQDQLLSQRNYFLEKVIRSKNKREILQAVNIIQGFGFDSDANFNARVFWQLLIKRWKADGTSNKPDISNELGELTSSIFSYDRLGNAGFPESKIQDGLQAELNWLIDNPGSKGFFNEIYKISGEKVWGTKTIFKGGGKTFSYTVSPVLELLYRIGYMPKEFNSIIQGDKSIGAQEYYFSKVKVLIKTEPMKELGNKSLEITPFDFAIMGMRLNGLARVYCNPLLDESARYNRGDRCPARPQVFDGRADVKGPVYHEWDEQQFRFQIQYRMQGFGVQEEPVEYFGLAYNYILGLDSHPEMIEPLIQAIQSYRGNYPELIEELRKIQRRNNHRN